MDKTLSFILSCFAVVLILSLVCFNLKTYFSSNLVLGSQTEIDPAVFKLKLFWEDFLTNHPDYLPGWIELAKLDKESGNPLKSFEDLVKAKEINPNSPALPHP